MNAARRQGLHSICHTVRSIPPPAGPSTLSSPPHIGQTGGGPPLPKLSRITRSSSRENVTGVMESRGFMRLNAYTEAIATVSLVQQQT
jgi:hypothetical protein